MISECRHRNKLKISNIGRAKKKRCVIQPPQLVTSMHDKKEKSNGYFSSCLKIASRVKLSVFCPHNINYT